METKNISELAAKLSAEVSEIKEALATSEARVEYVKESESGNTVAKTIAVMAKATHGGLESNSQFSKVAEEYGDNRLAKSLHGLDYRGLGRLVHHDVEDEIKDILRPASAFMAAGPEIRSYVGNAVDMHRFDNEIAGTWRGECAVPEKDDLQIATVTMKAKVISVDVKICRELRMRSLRNIEQDVIQQIQRGFGTGIDRAIFTSDGTQKLPDGLPAWLKPANSVSAGTVWASATADQIEDDLYNLLGLLQDANVIDAGSRVALFMSPKNKRTLIQLRDGNGNKFFPELRAGSLLQNEYKVHASTNVGDDYVYIVDMSKMRVGNFGDGLDLRVLQETPQSCSGEIVVRADLDIGFAPWYGGAEIARLKVTA